jgi:hypothetical protein
MGQDGCGVGLSNDGSLTYIDELRRLIAVGHCLRHSECLIVRYVRYVSLEDGNVRISFELNNNVEGEE